MVKRRSIWLRQKEAHKIANSGVSDGKRRLNAEVDVGIYEDRRPWDPVVSRNHMVHCCWPSNYRGDRERLWALVRLDWYSAAFEKWS